MTGEMGFRRYRGCRCLENTLRDIHMSKIGAGLFFEDRSTIVLSKLHLFHILLQVEQLSYETIYLLEENLSSIYTNS